MKYLLKDIQSLMEGDDSFRREAAHFSRNMKTNELKFMQTAILIIKGTMANELFSYRHTNLEAYEKDVMQRTCYNINQFLDFLASPEGWLREKNKIKQMYANATQKVANRLASGGKK